MAYLDEFCSKLAAESWMRHNYWLFTNFYYFGFICKAVNTLFFFVILTDVVDFQEMTSSKDGCRERLTSAEFINLFKEVSTRPEIYFLLMRSVYIAVLEVV